MKEGRNSWPGPVLALAVMASAAFSLAVGRGEHVPRASDHGPVPTISPENAFLEPGGAITIRSSAGSRLWYGHQGDPPAITTSDGVVLRAEPHSRSIARMLATPTAMHWRHPMPGLPEAVVVRAAEGDRSHGPFVMRTYLADLHGDLPVISIAVEEDDLFGASRGIAVVGDGILKASQEVLTSYAQDLRWWKYPGNYHGRGKGWQREARMQIIGNDGREILQTDVGLRINGQMTRGFPQHAFRLLFKDPLPIGPFTGGQGKGARSLVLRAAGNDQVKAMMRDAYQHALCAGLPFETSRAMTCVLYINGAYMGVYHLRERIDEKELARRYDVSAKRITILEDKNELYRGDSVDMERFLRLMSRTEKWNGKDPVWLDTLEAHLDVNGFLTYMASQMVLGNMDWPRQNVKYWRYTGKPRDQAPLDGRWYFIMGDSDLGSGANAPVSTDLFVKVKAAHVPVSRLFLAMLRSPELKERFTRIVDRLISGPLSPSTCVHRMDSLVGLMEPEMERHTARWRKPTDIAAWRTEVAVMRGFAEQRAGIVREQMNAFEKP